MPSPRHDAINEAFTKDPGLAVHALRNYVGVKANLPTQIGDTHFNDRASTDFDADALITVGQRQNPVHVIIVEIQQRGPEEKRRQLPRYAAMAWLMYRCPITVLVVCPSTATAAKFRDPIETSLPGYIFQAAVLGPEEVPLLTDPEEVASNPNLAALQMMAHGHREDVREIFLKGVEGLPSDYALEYYDHVRRMTADSVSRTLEELMKKTTVYDEIAREHEATAVFDVLSARGLEVSEDERTRIAACQDLDQLVTWLRRAAIAESVDELFR